MYRLLLVDDEADTREALSSYFPWQEVGFQIIGQCGNGKEALNFIENNDKIDVILTDIKMPVMSGLELAEVIHEQKHNIHVIFLSSYREFEYAQKALRYRVNNYIVKPAKYQVLLDVFASLRDELEAAKRALDQPPSVTGNEGLIITQIKSYIQDQYKNANLEDAAKQVYLNANYLSYLFKQKTGQNFTDYLIQVKMKVAMRLIQENQFKTYEISEMVGYSNAKNFTRTFKSFYGKTPSEYKNG
ncbi:DNA-binding response regulator [Paenibacillus sp. FSL H8-0548]|uniref:response regulator transcription factor n=1 Tax=Paenibacillus sp. FSL H8-0548 TaxID=1920422 RepID=UPI00096E22C0|nr:response regulator [Paenibacillus sp. FSL H8-0548]OMF21087.1 DNA-binding response regulator [Paenibacillus sp. FSL H8-0548]